MYASDDVLPLCFRAERERERARGPTAAGTPSENALVPPPPILFATMGRVGTVLFSGLEIEAMIWIKVPGWKLGRIRFRGRREG